MKNGTVSKVKALVLAASIVSIAGCDIGAAQPQAASDASESHAPNVRYQVDQARKRVWILNGDGVFLYDVAARRGTLLPLPNWEWVGALYSCLPDLALGPRGEAVITSNVLPTLWRIDPETLAVSEHPLALDADTDRDMGFSGLTYSAEQGAFFAVSDIHGSLWRIDPQLKSARKITLSAPIPRACGLAVRSRIVRQKTFRPAGLCVHAAQGGWAVDLSLDQRSAYVRAMSCTDR
jgi:hypothetical protein